MGSKPPAPKQPEKTLKCSLISYSEFIDENCKEINNMRREFNRDCMKLQYENKKMSKDLKKLIKDNGATVQNIFTSGNQKEPCSKYTQKRKNH